MGETHHTHDQKRAVDRSPVRSLLALPSPPDYPEVGGTPTIAVTVDDGMKWKEYLWLVMFTLKVCLLAPFSPVLALFFAVADSQIMSLQPNVLGVQLPPAVVLCLVIVAVLDIPFNSVSLAMSGGLLLIHVSALLSAKLNA